MGFELVTRHDILDEILEQHRAAAGGAFDGYRGHAYRMLNYVRYQLPAGVNHDDVVAVAAAFHDLPLTFDWDADYVLRAADLAVSYVEATGRPEWAGPVRLMIEKHHKPIRYRGASAALVEAVRRADFVDISFGVRRFGIPRALVKEVSAAFPTTGFYPSPVLGTVVRHAVTHPLRPFPWLKW